MCGTRIGTSARAEGEVVLAWSIVHLGSWGADVSTRWDFNANIGAWDISESHQDGFDIGAWNTAKVLIWNIPGASRCQLETMSSPHQALLWLKIHESTIPKVRLHLRGQLYTWGLVHADFKAAWRSLIRSILESEVLHAGDEQQLLPCALQVIKLHFRP